MSTKEVNQAVLDASAVVGSQKALATKLGVQPPTVNEWVVCRRPVPLARCMEIETLTGVPCERLNDSIDWKQLRALMSAKRRRAAKATA